MNKTKNFQGIVDKPAFQFHSLRINNLKSPLGIDERSLRFSWQLKGLTRGDSPTASQVRVASSAELLQNAESVLWESERIEGTLPYMDCESIALTSHKRYWWRVAVWDHSGRCLESEPTFFDTGLFSGDWQAEWIWNSKKIQINDFAYLRKEIILPQTAAYAKVFVSAHNVMQLYINGKQIAGLGTPAPTNPWEHKYYTAYDVTSLLQTGANCIAAVTHFLGGGGQNYVNGLPGFRLQLEVEYSDGAAQMFKTDDTWEVLKEIPHRVGTQYQQNRRISAIEDFDARKQDMEWLRCGFRKAKCRKAVLAEITTDAWPMKWQAIPEGIIRDVLIPKKIDPLDQGIVVNQDGLLRQVFDTGRIVSGWPRIVLKGIEGVTLRLRYSEDLDEAGYVKHNVCNEASETYFDQYTMRGDKTEKWQPDLTYKAFRYVEVTGYPELLLPGENIWIVSAHTDMAYEGSFHCSSHLLNRLYEASIHTQQNNVLGQTVDCPHREQAQYLADSDLQAELMLYNFQASQVLEKVLSDFADGQFADGTFSFVYPSNVEDPAFKAQIPEWDLHFCTLLWKLYFIYDDLSILKRYFNTAKRMASYYIRILDPINGLVPLDKGWHISDWPYSNVDHDNSLFLTVQNVKLYQALIILADAALLIGQVEEHNTYTLIADKLKMNMLKHLYDSEHKQFRDGLGSQQAHQGVGGIAVLSGLAPQADREQIIRNIIDKPWESKTVLSLPLLRMLFENGHKEEAYRYINRPEYPGWGYMIMQGATTLWEGWDDMDSHSHAWNGYPSRLLQEYIVGIQPLAPGFAEVLIQPYMPEDLTYAEAEVLSIYGLIGVRWERLQGEKEKCLAVSIPVGVKGRVVLDADFADDNICIRESGQLIWGRGLIIPAVDGIIHCEQTLEGIQVTLHCGEYEFIWGR